MTHLDESPYGESRVIIWDTHFFVVLHSWAELSERAGWLENITLYPCRKCNRMPDYPTLDRDFVAGTLYWPSWGEDHYEYAFYCRPCAAQVVREFGYVRAEAFSADEPGT